jgi:hypothetical protein
VWGIVDALDAVSESLRKQPQHLGETMSNADLGRRPDSVASSDEELVQILREGQFLILRHPVAAQAALQALVAEGRRFAETADGRRWKDRLARSELIRRGRMIWQGSVLNMLEEDSPAPLPSAFLDAVLAASASENLPALLSQLFLDQDDDDDADDS